MLVIRQQQMRILANSQTGPFENRLYELAVMNHPDVVGRLAEPAVRAWIRGGIERAATYGIDRQRSVSVYLDVLFTFGPDFERLSWAMAVLSDPSYSDGASRANALQRAALAQTGAPMILGV